ncbi:uncharacterized protein LOC132637484 [Lycium barbarum]|uniref:uncharacterized protein LOC132637484 n=1 Tax=Lycium barbarum TaxID=112863 RepID=UPI00293F55B3|nr:uncharacterized protein LOC132637484 [Lycium barbarum]
MRLKTYNSLDEAFHDASKVETDLKEERSYKHKSKSSSTWNKGKEKWNTSSWDKPKSNTQAPQAKFTKKPMVMTWLKEGTKYILNPLTLYQVSEDYRVMRELRNKYRREEKEKGEKETLLVISGEGTSQDGSKKCLLAKPSNCLKGVDERHFMVCLVNKDLLLNANQATSTLPRSMSSLLQEYEALFSKEMPDGLPPMRGIEHQIDFIPGSQIPNKPAYRSNPQETKELQRQVDELLKKGLVKECLSPCAILVILVPKKDGTWRMCIDCRAVNKITGLDPLATLFVA